MLDLKSVYIDTRTYVVKNVLAQLFWSNLASGEISCIPKRLYGNVGVTKKKPVCKYRHACNAYAMEMYFRSR